MLVYCHIAYRWNFSAVRTLKRQAEELQATCTVGLL